MSVVMAMMLSGADCANGKCDVSQRRNSLIIRVPGVMIGVNQAKVLPQPAAPQYGSWKYKFRWYNPQPRPRRSFWKWKVKRWGR